MLEKIMKLFKVHFSSNLTLKDGTPLYLNGSLDNGVQIFVITEDGKFYGMKLDSHVTQLLYGRIFICDELVEFNDSYIDGCDNYFKKIQ